MTSIRDLSARSLLRTREILRKPSVPKSILPVGKRDERQGPGVTKGYVHVGSSPPGWPRRVRRGVTTVNTSPTESLSSMATASARLLVLSNPHVPLRKGTRNEKGHGRKETRGRKGVCNLICKPCAQVPPTYPPQVSLSSRPVTLRFLKNLQISKLLQIHSQS